MTTSSQQEQLAPTNDRRQKEVAAITGLYGQQIERFRQHVSQSYPQFRWYSYLEHCSDVPCIGFIPEEQRFTSSVIEMFPLQYLFGQDGALVPAIHKRLEAAVRAFTGREEWQFIEATMFWDIAMGHNIRSFDFLDSCRIDQILIQQPDIRFRTVISEWEWGFKSASDLFMAIANLGYLIRGEHDRFGRTDTMLGHLERPAVIGSPNEREPSEVSHRPSSCNVLAPVDKEVEQPPL
jgi:hypothetical protein